MTLARDGVAAFEPQDLERLDDLLAAFLAEAHARWAAVVDRAGQVLTAAGDTAELDRVTFGSLAAADFAASDQLASLLGEREFVTLYHQGERRSLCLADVAGSALLAAVFDGRTTLGLVRLRMKSVLPELVALFQEVAARRSAASHGLEAGWVAEAQDEIDRLFTD
mgnify:CR=1 FL=1